LTSDQPASGVSVSVPYTGGNGGTHSGQAVNSTGVTGLTATLAAGSFANGAGNLVYTITGTPAANGPAVFVLNIGGQNCELVLTVQAGEYSGTISTLVCSCPKITGTLKNGQPAAGVNSVISYTGGNNSAYGSQVVASTGVTGLYATVAAGNFNSGSGELSYAISGTPTSSGTANFAVNVAGKNCTLSMTVASSGPVCRAKISATEYKNFMCYNLGAANTAADPFTPSWEINGGYWQWGKLTEAAAGPIGSDLASANDGAVPGWSNVGAGNTAWQNGTKTATDPCPSGYRVPTSNDWGNVMANNTLYYRGADAPVGPTNYGFGLQIGEELFLPAAGNRLWNTGALQSRGDGGFYWTSTSLSTANAWFLNFWKCGYSVAHFDRCYGFAIRCIAEDAPAAGTIGALDCGSANPTGTLTAGTAASGVSASVPYTGGNGGTHSGQTVASTGVTGLTATLAAGSFANGTGNLSYAVTGTPSGTGTASFALNIGGKSCTLELTVAAAGSSCTCCAKINATDYKNFMCHNLGAANTSADPLTPSWEINGGYWQWGRAAQAAAGPTGAGAGETNEGPVSGWDSSYPADGSWLDASKSGNDPCPSGFRVPTKDQWAAVVANNTQTPLGSWGSSSTNYSSGRTLGAKLMLPGTGWRVGTNGSLINRGFSGLYWSSTHTVDEEAWSLYLDSGGATWDYTDDRRRGFSIRCIAE
jgi:uncharacterized protein (TIGR02145 family)